MLCLLQVFVGDLRGKDKGTACKNFGAKFASAFNVQNRTAGSAQESGGNSQSSQGSNWQNSHASHWQSNQGAPNWQNMSQPPNWQNTGQGSNWQQYGYNSQPNPTVGSHQFGTESQHHAVGSQYNPTGGGFGGGYSPTVGMGSQNSAPWSAHPIPEVSPPTQSHASSRTSQPTQSHASRSRTFPGDLPYNRADFDPIIEISSSRSNDEDRMDDLFAWESQFFRLSREV